MAAGSKSRREIRTLIAVAVVQCAVVTLLLSVVIPRGHMGAPISPVALGYAVFSLGVTLSLLLLLVRGSRLTLLALVAFVLFTVASLAVIVLLYGGIFGGALIILGSPLIAACLGIAIGNPSNGWSAVASGLLGILGSGAAIWVIGQADEHWRAGVYGGLAFLGVAVALSLIRQSSARR